LQHLRGQADDLHEPLVPQLTADRAEDARAPRVSAVLDEDRRVLVEADVGPVRAPELLRGADDHGLDHVALLDAGPRDGVLDRGHDDVADAGVATARATEHPDAQDLPRTGVVGDLQSRLLLNHLARSRISTMRQRLVADSGRVSMMDTRSPTWAELFSSWA